MAAAASAAYTICLLGVRAAAQDPAAAVNPQPTAQGAERRRPAQSNLPDCLAQSQRNEIAAGRLHFAGNVECQLPDGVKVSADEMDVFTEDEKNRIVAWGSVAFNGPEANIAADRLEYDTSTRLGVFEAARGYLYLGDEVGREGFGGRDPVVYFAGTRLEKLGPRRYRVEDGWWTTCEQPTPRWEFTTSSMVINLEDYVVATHAVLRVKGVPLFYTPYIYYPIKKEDRATGFLTPTYGLSTFRGQAISNAFFWAIGRSHDATFLHDWFTRAGQGAGTEYRYAVSPESSGAFRAYTFWRQQTESTENGVTTVLPSTTSYELTGTAVQALWPSATARVRLDYFSDVQSQQLLHQNIYEASRRNRVIEGGLTAAFGPLATNVLYQRNEIVNNVSDTFVTGSTPRASAMLAPSRLFRTPVYASVNAEYAYLPQRRMLDGEPIQDDSFGRLDVAPTVRVPLSRLSFLAVNTSATYRTTYYTRQAGITSATQPGSYVRQYASSRTDVVGPVLSRVFERPGSRFAERLKHVIEPAFAVDFTSEIADFRRTPVSSDVTDFVVSNSTRVTYGVTNRLFSRSRTSPDTLGAAREFLTIGVQQTYYSKPESGRFDGTYSSGQSRGALSDLSPVALTARVSPGGALDANARIEFDTSTGAGMQLLTTGATISSERAGLTLNYSRQRFGTAASWTSYTSASARTSLLDNRVTAAYNLSYDIARRYLVSQSIHGSYMAQCCGVQVEYQRFNYPTGSGLPVTSDRRLNVSFVLSGIGTFSNFFGAFGGG
jgi:lipopolysaccharide assembly outer membrane protein LptD (OstA)